MLPNSHMSTMDMACTLQTLICSGQSFVQHLHMLTKAFVFFCFFSSLVNHSCDKPLLDDSLLRCTIAIVVESYL
jgi:hypothetical protein